MRPWLSLLKLAPTLHRLAFLGRTFGIAIADCVAPTLRSHRAAAPKQVTINEIFRGTMPYIWIVVAFMVLMYAFPGMALWLPKYMYG